MLLSRNTIFSLTTSRADATFHEVIYNYKIAGALLYLFTPCMECCGHANCLCISFDREYSNERKDKRITMAQ